MKGVYDTCTWGADAVSITNHVVVLNNQKSGQRRYVINSVSSVLGHLELGGPHINSFGLLPEFHPEWDKWII